ncbi:MAG: O-antigen ligase family protein [Candidatus Binatia bacterium]
MNAAITFFKVVVTCFLIMNIVDSFRRIERIFLLISVVLVIFATDIGWKYLQGRGHGEMWGMVGGMFGNPNDLAVNLVLFLPLTYYFFLVNKDLLVKLAWLCCFGITIFGIVGTQSRGGMLAAAIVLLLLLVRTGKKKVAFLVCGMMVLVVVAFAPSRAFERLKTVVDYDIESSAKTRLWFYESSLRMMSERVVTGVGIGAWPTAYAADFRHPEDDTRRWPDAHSTYFQIMGELGIPGITVYLFMLYVAFRSLRDVEKRSQGRRGYERQVYFAQCLRIGIIGFSFAVIFQAFTYQHALFNVMALIAALERLYPGDLQEGSGLGV